ncbi:MAG: 30S ribosomal protein S14 [Alphaproteobacteria bacterium]|nr:30S ribosomal protein S14 [Alphaproteobacteria bacterium]MBN2780220.1 30S ribosomal protein S14 [Alphaproteobacteria bacterium]
MAKACMLPRDLKRRKLVKRYQPKRDALLTVARDRNANPEERFEASQKLAKLPRNGTRVRLHNRCQLTGRGKGVYRKFKLCRIQLRDLANNGLIPGMKKASW